MMSEISNFMFSLRWMDWLGLGLLLVIPRAMYGDDKKAERVGFSDNGFWWSCAYDFACLFLPAWR